ncbi:MAG: K(+)-transporting ATPase subunit C [Pseudomonadota bacterium]
MNPILKETLSSIRALAVLVVLCCVLYPITVYAIGQTAFRWKANGSLVDKDGNPSTPENAAGSRLLGQSFTSPGYFHPRPSAAGSGYDAASSSGTNLGPISDKFLNGTADDPKTKDVDESYAGIKQLVQAYREENGLGPDVLVPGDAVTRSASGLDPHVSPRNADLQVARVAKARGLEEGRVRSLVREATEGRGWGLFGEPGVNVLMLNISLDKITKPAPSQNHLAQGS